MLKVLLVMEAIIVGQCFLLENLLTDNHFPRMNISRYNKKHQRDIYFIGLGVEGDTIINPSTQFQY